MFRARLIACTLAVTLAFAACMRTRSIDNAPSPSPSASPSPSPSPSPSASPSADSLTAIVDVGPPDAYAEPWSPPPSSAIDGPHEDLTLDAGRPVYYAASKAAARPARLVGHLHGMCGPPVYSCGRWIGAGTDVGMMVCPTGNARCGDSPVGPASWEAPTWPELVGIMDADLEGAIAKVQAKRPGALSREGAVLTGYSRGAFAAPSIARRHPHRWPYLVLIEANVTLTKESLAASGVRAVALVAGELGDQIAGMRKTEKELSASGVAIKLFVMKRTGHPYSEDMEQVMHEALGYVLSQAHND